MDKKAYKEYKRRIAQAVAKVNNKPLKFQVSAYYKLRDLSIDANRMKEIDKENMDLLKRMNLISRLGGKVDCWISKVKYNSNIEDPRKQNSVTMKSNKALLRRINQVVSDYNATEFIRNWKEAALKTQHGRRFQSEATARSTATQINEDQCMVRDPSFLKQLNPSIRSKCFFDIEIEKDKQKLGSIYFELYDDVVPQTCANFIEFCRGTSNGLSYKSTPFHRIVSGYWCQGGDVTKFNGSGGISIYENPFEKENFDLHHAGPGVLSMCHDNENKCNSKFNLTFRRLESMDGKHVVFGKVIFGLSNIYKIEEFGTKTGKPIKTVIISNCGVIPAKRNKFIKSDESTDKS